MRRRYVLGGILVISLLLFLATNLPVYRAKYRCMLRDTENSICMDEFVRDYDNVRGFPYHYQNERLQQPGVYDSSLAFLRANIIIWFAATLLVEGGVLLTMRRSSK